MSGQTPTPWPVVDRMLSLASVGPGDRVYDLGCGDGRIVIAAAQRGASAVGIDSSAEQIVRAEAGARSAHVSSLVNFRCGPVENQSLADATVVTSYLSHWANCQLRPKLQRELQHGARIVSHSFDMGDWAPHRVETIDHRYLYLWVLGGPDVERQPRSRPLALHCEGLPKYGVSIEVETQGEGGAAVLINDGPLDVTAAVLEYEFRNGPLNRRSVSVTRFSLRSSGDAARDVLKTGGRVRLTNEQLSAFFAGRCREDFWTDLTVRVNSLEVS
jgi:SAM-dependent methyltransferase